MIYNKRSSLGSLIINLGSYPTSDYITASGFFKAAANHQSSALSGYRRRLARPIRSAVLVVQYDSSTNPHIAMSAIEERCIWNAYGLIQIP